MDSASQVAEMKQLMFLRRIAEISGGDPARWVPTGILGEELGLSYEESLAITDALREQGLIRRGGGGRLEAPQGPRVHILPEGIAFLEKS